MVSLDGRVDRGRILPQVLKALRRRRGLSAVEVAAALCMPLRSYEHFESGRGRLNVGRVHRVAKVLGADAYAILLAIEMGSPEFALRCADNKLVAILVMALQDFDVAAGDDMAALDPRTLIESFTRMFDELAATARDRVRALDIWRAGRGGPPDSEADT
jgi:transcriptional regulator with XRE-family HTH domain